jgi:putative transposase
MPGRSTPIISGYAYHVYNRGINHQPTFASKRNYDRFITTLKYYKYVNLPVKLSRFLSINDTNKNEILLKLQNSESLVDIIAYCLMPNHYHLLLKQNTDGGISKYIANVQNSYTKYFNTRNARDGALFLNQFKAVRIESDDQMIHISRYINLNPYTGYVIKEFKDIYTYLWSSIKEYMERPVWCNIDPVLAHFRNKNEYQKYLNDQASYQRELSSIRHVVCE